MSVDREQRIEAAIEQALGFGIAEGCSPETAARLALDYYLAEPDPVADAAREVVASAKEGDGMSARWITAIRALDAALNGARL